MLKITNLKKSYGKNEVLKGINLKVKKGEIKAIIGENSAGKTTLIEVLCGVKQKNSGEIIINNLNLNSKKDVKYLKRDLGYMPQYFCLYQDLTVEENIKYVCSVYGVDLLETEKIIKLCFLEDKKNFLTQNLSGGYRQLLSMACAIVHKPKLLILDEPTSAMDPVFRRKFWKIVKQINKQGTTILLITHYLEELLECDSFACLSKGKIVFDGKVAEFKKSNFIDIEDILSKFSSGENNGEKN